MDNVNYAQCGAAGSRRPVSAQQALRERASELRISADRILERARKLDAFRLSLPGVLPGRAADAVRELFGLPQAQNVGDALTDRVGGMHGVAHEKIAEAEGLEILAEALPGVMLEEAHAAVREQVGF